MCGILGVLNPVQSDVQRFAGALESISHRGPDGEGVWSDAKVLLGHRRLAIIDLSEDGLQPMADPETGAVIVYNGEIYNYLELRTELEGLGARFRTRTDTEVLLKAYALWGAGMLDRLNGMWAFAIWDSHSNQMFVARDRFGVKPFYYAEVEGRFLFASEPKALLSLVPQLADPDPDAIAHLFSSTEMHAGGRSFYRNIRSLPAASCGFVSPGALLRLKAYWNYPDADDSDTAPFDFGQTLESAVHLRLRSDVPVGLTLSGGLDSSAILAAAGSVSGNSLQCFTSVYGDTSRGEEHWAQIAADLARAPLTTVDSDLADWHATLRKAIHHMDSPSYSPAIVPSWAMMKAARERGITVLLEGQGADELLGGYPRYALPLLRQVIRGRSGWAQVPTEMATLRRSFGARWIALWSARQAFPGAYRLWSHSRSGNAILQEGLRERPATAEDPAGAGLFDLLKDDHCRQILPALLHYGDAISMAHGVESRLPFMDYRLVEQVFRKRPSLISGGRTKAPVRDYLQARGFAQIANRLDKRGYPTPIHTWIAQDGGKFMSDLLGDTNHPLWTYLKRKATAQLFQRAVTGNAAALFQVFKVATTAMWLEDATRARLPGSHAEVRGDFAASHRAPEAA
ncbi:MAG: asparagine synthase (glutamine-hydrolyzing) [Alphaproteobacteria bacterium]|nr:asparagine synthase (glutamine-hydrolyzing) [Alphaproteobacteria bacterium]MBU1525479.1 asparagine synthase (glutamine-hydrolyzing) [Alphaproteobacteria bacterium]MBU2116309.1 asparagine synthase (glutamine-hydrolyzing) [Alphaproteobacteria bacterium]MBU2350881.1 asparagine synthase (glutamine-hydrolyzing) [Alphaproteobacteria bacterium]MBU2381738.1 asparagine synthase (glutamine-hydrolyzing) [Alphaproteobacteria bacterium]